MRKVIKTVMMAAFTAIAMSASAASVQTYSASSDSVLTQPVDTLSEKLTQMENRVNTLEKEQNYTKVWKRKKYWKFGITQPNLERTDGEAMTWKTNGSFFIQQGRTAYLHAKPIAGLIKIGIDYGFFDFTYTKLKLNNVGASDQTGTRASDGFDDIVSGKPDGNPSVLPGNINLGMHKFDYSVHVGPSVSVNPWNKLIAAAYFHVMPTATGVLQNDTFAYGFGCMMAAGVSVAYKCISLGVEGLWGKVKYKQASFDGGDDDGDYDGDYDSGSDYDEGDSESYFSTEKFTLKQSGIRAYVAIRF